MFPILSLVPLSFFLSQLRKASQTSKWVCQHVEFIKSFALCYTYLWVASSLPNGSNQSNTDPLEAVRALVTSANEVLKHQAFITRAAETQKELNDLQEQLEQKNVMINELDITIRKMNHAAHEEVAEMKLEKSATENHARDVESQLKAVLEEKGTLAEQGSRSKAALQRYNQEVQKLKNELQSERAEAKKLDEDLREEKRARLAVVEQLTTLRRENDRYRAYRSELSIFYEKRL